MYLFRQRRTSKITRPVQIIAMILLVALFTFLLVRWTPISGVAQAVQSRLYSTSITLNTFLVQTFSSSESLHSQIENYKSIADKAVTDQAYTYQLEKRVQELEQLLGYSQTVEYEITTARILSHSQSGEYTILIDQGSHNQIEEGFAVVANDGYLIGIVDSV
ncbi:hypothetical protein KJ673_02455, partial [Patescibacteria group bacterium]|nr:hypothetical protein [Patescibacteria group bacterium]MCG2687682.1 hypothetical protein [Candidatus Parcubacteria bacterium]